MCCMEIVCEDNCLLNEEKFLPLNLLFVLLLSFRYVFWSVIQSAIFPLYSRQLSALSIVQMRGQLVRNSNIRSGSCPFSEVPTRSLVHSVNFPHGKLSVRPVLRLTNCRVSARCLFDKLSARLVVR